ncbi:F0F1 ATP synthase subunit gamma [Rhodanobacter sp. AS-Z3]|uniref:F0F1 ATP synthase subunit gamma n=1 Tax=Rhodanobacter sp. AS-Z3 TaxID=3031330 RepID=UPI0024790DE3|nr:F0F1 ATP synthase subunit gamma [Rhodanobacter sp. AS-Z3]WEN16577.1 F0F1 ATP synthase subunit gamma [Rhodanobacter sp. AS-Z3]
MSGNLQSLRRKIDGARDLQGVVRSMKALAASSIGQYEKAVRSLADYRRTVELSLAVSLREGVSTPLATRRKVAIKSIGAIVLGSDQGLVGGFNEVLAEFVSGTLTALPGKVKKIWAVGERIQLLMRDIEPAHTVALSVPGSVHGITPLVGQLLIDIEAARERGEVENIHVFYNHPKSGAVYEPVSTQLLPLDREWGHAFAAIPWPSNNVPQIIGPAAPALQAFIREYLFVVLYQACAESLASENGSRLAAMQRAEKNIQDMLETLNGSFRRIRQESIDEELFDVIAGYEALAGKLSP